MVLAFTYTSTYEHHACTPARIVSTAMYTCRHYTNTHTQSNKAIHSAKAMHLYQLGASKILETSTWGHLHTWPSHVPLIYKLLLRKASSIQVTPNIPLFMAKFHHQPQCLWHVGQVSQALCTLISPSCEVELIIASAIQLKNLLCTRCPT